MQIGGVIQAPPRPQAPPGARSLDVDYTAPVTRDTVIGRIPSFTFSATPVDLSEPDTDVVRPQPVLDAAGNPTWMVKTEKLDLTPYSPWRKGAIGSAIGAAVGGALGLAAGFFTGEMVLCTSLGVGAGMATGAAIGAGRVLGDQVTPEWEPRQVVQHHFEGYNHTFIPQTTTITTGKTTTTITTGYHHHYDERVRQEQVGDYYYWHPVARHSADR